MSAAATAMRISKSRPFWLIGMVVAVLAGFFFSICVGVVHDASLQELHPADAIVVFGAAEYSGRPSPVYRARLDHAFDLFQRGIAPVIVTTGGAAAGLSQPPHRPIASKLRRFSRSSRNSPSGSCNNS